MFLGLELLLIELTKQQQQLYQYNINNNNNNLSLTKIVEDIQVSGELALHLINDLLLYDKMETSLMTLETEMLPIWSTVKKCIQPFYIQVNIYYLYYSYLYNIYKYFYL